MADSTKEGLGFCREAWRGFFWPTGAVTLGLIGLAVAVAIVNQPEFTGDPAIYRDRIAPLFSGEVPYVGFEFEHFPVSAIPMVLAWVLGGVFDPEWYTAVFAVLMGICLLVTTGALCRIESRTGLGGITARWMAMAGLLFPIVLFRSDPLVVVLAVLALYSTAMGQEKASYRYQLSAVFAKGWPVLYAIPDWSRGRRRQALSLAGASLVLAGFLFWAPGFLQARSFNGLHSETVSGALVIGMRTATGEPLELLYEAGATYVAVPTWALILHVNIAILVGLIVFARFSAVEVFENLPQVVAGLLLVLLLASPLLSPQFLIWLVPFLVFFKSRAIYVWGLLVTGLTLVYMVGWNADFLGNPWWIYMLNARNAALVVLAVLSAWELGRAADAPSLERRIISSPP